VPYTELKEKLKLHSTKKFESLGALNEWKDFINKI
jgi:hypothetical protein